MPSCCFYGPVSTTFSPYGDDLTTLMALVYQIDALINRGIYVYNTCLLPGIDSLCACHISGIAIDPRDEDAVARLRPRAFARLRVHVFNIPFSDDSKKNEDTMNFLKTAASIHIDEGASEDDRIKRAIEASTHMLAVCPEGEAPFPVSYAQQCGLTVMRFSTSELIYAFRHDQPCLPR